MKRTLRKREERVLWEMQQQSERWWYVLGEGELAEVCHMSAYIYAPLYSLEKRFGLIESRLETDEERQERQLARRMYRVTATGRWTRVASAAPSFLSRLRRLVMPGSGPVPGHTPTN